VRVCGVLFFEFPALGGPRDWLPFKNIPSTLIFYAPVLNIRP